MYTVIIYHTSLEAGEIDTDPQEVYRETFSTPLAAALALSAQIEGGMRVPPRRHGHMLIEDQRGNKMPLNAFCNQHGIKQRSRP